MTYSEIKIEFLEEVQEGGEISFFVLNRQTNTSFQVLEKWVSWRSNRNEVSTRRPSSTVGQVSAYNYLNSFNLDYNGSGNDFETSTSGNKVVIKSKNPNLTFNLFFAWYFPQDDSPLGPILDRPLNVIHKITNYELNLFKIESFQLLSSSVNPCSSVKVRIKANEVIKKVISPITLNNNSFDFVEFDVLRNGGSFTFICENSDGQRVSKSYNSPNRLIADNINTTINNSPYGATVIVTLMHSFDLVLQYSIDGSNWQSSNVFPSVTEGSYVVHIKDQFGCSIHKNIIIDSFGISVPEFYISKSNSIRYIKSSENGNETDKRIDDNRLSYNDKVEIPYTQYHCYSKLDNEPTQFRTNYENLIVKAVTNSNQEVRIFPEKKTNNIGLKDSRDAYVFPLENGNTGIYFKSGNKYNFDTGEVIGDYDLMGGVPEWGKIGVYMRISNSWFEIKNVYPDDDKQAEVLEVETRITETEVLEKVGVIYNRDTVDVYEFRTDMGLFESDEYFTLKIEADDQRFHAVEYQSERIKVFSDLSDHVEIIYSNDTNTDILYSTGIKFKIWLRLEKDSVDPEASINTQKTDTNVILIDGTIHEAKEFVFEPTTGGMFMILYKALSHRNLFIDGMPFKLSSPPEKVDDYGNTNLYSLKAKLFKNNGIHKSRTFDTDLPITGDLLDLPPLIQIQPEGYIKI